MVEEDTYRILSGKARTVLKVKGSRFIAEALPVASAGAAEAALAAVREREHAATHHCTAYRVGPGGTVFRYNDDGEPHGTAGPPILQQIDGRGLTNTLVVVTRYYGGTKLGTGGLARAYGEAAARVLDACAVEERVVRTPLRLRSACAPPALRLRFAYEDTSLALRTLHRFNAEVQASRYTEATELLVGVRRSEAKAFARAFTEALGGRGTVEKREED